MQTSVRGAGFIDELVTKRFPVTRSGGRCCGAARGDPSHVDAERANLND
jgi:hypothetical protein